MDRGQQRLRQTAWRGPCAGGLPRWRGRHAYACEDGSRAYGHGGGCWADTYACSRVVPHAGGGVISGDRFPVSDRLPDGADAMVGERVVDGHRSFTDLRPVNTRQLSRRPTSQPYGRAGDRSNRRPYVQAQRVSSRHAERSFTVCAKRLLWSDDAASVRAVFGLFHSPPGGRYSESKGPNRPHTPYTRCG